MAENKFPLLLPETRVRILRPLTASLAQGEITGFAYHDDGYGEDMYWVRFYPGEDKPFTMFYGTTDFEVLDQPVGDGCATLI